MGFKAIARIGAVGAGLMVLSGCLQVPDNAMRQGPNGVEIQINEGRNCWGNQCYRYDAGKNEIVIAGREAITVPAGVDLSDGYVSEAEFAALLSAARKAPQKANTRQETADSGRSGGGTSSTGND